MNKTCLPHKRLLNVSLCFLVFISSASTLFLVGCRLPTMDQWNYTRQQPKSSDLVGAWLPDDSTLILMRNAGGYDSSVQTRLVLKSDGSFDLVNMPDWWSNKYGESSHGFESYSGSWKFINLQPTWAIQLRQGSETSMANLIGQSPPYRIEFIIGDADENKNMVFIGVVGENLPESIHGPSP